MAIAYAPKVALAILTLVLGFWIAGVMSKVVGNLLRRNKVEETIIAFLTSIVS